MQLSYATVYALQTLKNLATCQGGPCVSSGGLLAGSRMSRIARLPILRLLGAAGLLISARGQGSGHRLARTASRITLLDVIEAASGPVRGDAPPLRDQAQEGRELDARLQVVCEQAAEMVRKRMRKVTLKDLFGSG